VSGRRVVVTGIGAVSASGIGLRPLWDAARSGRSGVSEPEFDRPANNRVRIAAQLKNFDPSPFIDETLLPICDRFAQFALVAADEAISQAGFSRGATLGKRTAVIVGTGIGGYMTIDNLHHAYYVTKTRIDPFSIPRGMSNAAACLIGMRYGCTGPTFAVGSACSSASQSIGIGLMLVRSGAADCAIVGGSEAGVTGTGIRAWEALRVLTPDYCRPFSKGRNGMVLGEAAGILVLESADHAAARGAEPLAELAGYGTSSDAKDIVRPDVEGAAAAMRLALEDAGLPADAIDYVNAHGTGTMLNDVVESDALGRVFGDQVATLSVSSTKPIHGHTLGAAGAIELGITIMAMRESIVPPTINWLERDPKCPIDAVPNEARKVDVRAAMSNSFAFGGINASLVVTRPN
jgi:nodulation protein E